MKIKVFFMLSLILLASNFMCENSYLYTIEDSKDNIKTMGIMDFVEEGIEKIKEVIQKVKNTFEEWIEKIREFLASLFSGEAEGINYSFENTDRLKDSKVFCFKYKSNFYGMSNLQNTMKEIIKKEISNSASKEEIKEQTQKILKNLHVKPNYYKSIKKNDTKTTLGVLTLEEHKYSFTLFNNNLTLCRWNSFDVDKHTLSHDNPSYLKKGKFMKKSKKEVISKVSESMHINDSDKLADTYNTFTEITNKGLIINKSYKGNSVEIDFKAEGKKFSNIHAYEILEKSSAGSTREITGNYEIIRQDPVIGWNLGEMEEGESINVSYSASEDTNVSDNETLTVVLNDSIESTDKGLIQTAYRYECNAFEMDFMHLEDLTGGRAEFPTENNYEEKLCLSLLDIYNLTKDCNSRYVNIGRLTGNTNSYYTKEMIGKDLCLGIENDNYWFDVIIKEGMLNKNYSCIFSVDNLSNGEIGRCNALSKNFWVYVGPDNNTPNVSDNIKREYKGHVAHVVINASDRISGVKNIYYCKGSGCEPNKEYNNDLMVSCPTNGACDVTFRYYAEDYAGNNHSIVEKNMSLEEKKISCNEKCELLGTGRYYKDCYGVDGCEYYNNEVAEKCHGNLLGSYVDFNSTHEIRCPDGGLRENKLGEKGRIKSQGCDNLIKKSKTVLVDGESYNMNIYHCVE